MPRPPRLALTGLPHHLVIRGNDRRPIFFSDFDRLFFLDRLAQAATRRHCHIHAFVLMTNHVHLLATPNEELAASRAMQDIGRAYVAYVNKAHHRTGSLFEGRFRSSIVETSRYFLACMRYIERNPVRAGMAAHPGSYEWSSYGQNITGDPTGLVTPHPEYLNLGREAAQRAEAYARLFEVPQFDEELEAFRQGARQGKAVGSELFCRGLEGVLRRPVAFVPQGGPFPNR